MTDQRLKNILETFGQRCQIILDGFDEYTDVSGNKEHKDTIKMLKGQKLLSCNVLLTSKPHCISNVKEHFQTVVKINGFSKEHAGEFANKILNDVRKVQPVLEFECFTSNRYSFEGRHKCPILLLFVCFLVNEKEIDISKKDTTLGEIYIRLVRCLYRKFTFRKGLQFQNQGFFELLQRLGKIAWETLISGKYSMQRQEIEMIDEYVFDYGLIIGHEDYRLRGSETADIFITFVHRTIQEFLGSFYFVYVLSKGQQSHSLLPHGCKEPIFLSNRLVLDFCIWFISNCSNLLPIAEIDKARKALKSFILQQIDFTQMDLHEISLLYPALVMPRSGYREYFLTSEFCVEVLKECKVVKELYLGANCWILKEMKTALKNLHSIIMIDEKEFSPPFEDSSSDLHIVIRDDGYTVETIGKVSEYSKVSGKHPTLYSIIVSPGWDGSYPIELSTFMYNSLQRLFLVSKKGGYNIIANQSIKPMPFLTHLNLINVILTDGSVMPSLSAAVEAGHFPNLTHMSFAGCEINGSLPLFLTSKWPKLEHLDLHKCQLNMCNIEALAAATDARNSKCVLPNLSSLVLFTLWIENERNLIHSLFFSHPWTNLTNLALWSLRKKHYRMLTEILKCGKLPKLSQLSLSMFYRDQSQCYEVITSSCIPLLKYMKLKQFTVGNESSKTWCDNMLRDNLCRLHICESSGVGEMLFTLVSDSIPHLDTLILCNCGLNSRDLQTLANANVQGRLPELRHLDLSQNEKLQGQLNQLFTSDSTWNRLVSFNIELIRRNGSEIEDLTDVRTLFSQQALGNLKSLQEIRFTTGTEHPFPIDSGIQFEKLTKITVETPDDRVTMFSTKWQIW